MSRGIESANPLLRRLQSALHRAYSRPDLETKAPFTAFEERLIEEIKKTKRFLGESDLDRYWYRGQLENKEMNKYLLREGQLSQEEIIILSKIIFLFENWQRKITGNQQWEVFDEQIGALVRQISVYKDKEKRGQILEMATSEGKSSVVIPIFITYLGLFEDQIQVHTVTPYLVEEDYKRFFQWAEELGINDQVGKIDSEDISNSEKRREKMAKKFIFGYWADFIHSFQNDFLEEKNYTIAKKPLIVLDEIDQILHDELLVPAIIGRLIKKEDFLFDLFKTLKSYTKLGEVPSWETFPGMIKKGDRWEFDIDLFVKELKLYTEVFFEVLGLKFKVKGKEEFRRIETLEEFILNSEVIIETIKDWLKDQSDRDKKIYFFEHPAFFRALVQAYLLERGRHYEVIEGKIVPLAISSGYGEENKQFDSLINLLLFFKEGVELPDYFIDDIPSDRIHTQELYRLLFYLNGRIFGFTGTAASIARRLYLLLGIETCIIPSHNPTKREENWILIKDKKKREELLVEILETYRQNGLIIVSNGQDAKQIRELLMKNFPEDEVLILTPENQDEDGRLLKEISSKNDGKRRILIAAKMVGRGVDIKPDEEVKKEGFILVSFTPFELERTVRQAIGRIGRRGEVGKAFIFISPDDPIFKILSEREYQKLTQLIEKLLKEQPGQLRYLDSSELKRLLGRVWHLWEEKAVQGDEVIRGFSQPLIWLRKRLMEREIDSDFYKILIRVWPEIIDYLWHNFLIQLPILSSSKVWKDEWFLTVARPIRKLEKLFKMLKEEKISLSKRRQIEGLLRFLSINPITWFEEWPKIERYIGEIISNKDGLD